MSDPATGTFRPLDDDARLLHGSAPVLIACGCAPEEAGILRRALAEAGLAGLPLWFASKADAGRVLRALVADAARTGANVGTPLETRAVLAAGITQAQLHRAMQAYRASGLAPALWAALTPGNEAWTLEALLRELRREHAALGAALRGGARPRGNG